MQKLVLVTGAAGFIGSHTTELLLAKGFVVVGVDDLSTGSLENLGEVLGNPDFHFVEGDITEPGALNGVMMNHRPEAVIHLAGLVSVVRGQQDPSLNFRLNLESTHLVCEAARSSQVRRVVFASSAAIYGDCPDVPLDEYAPAMPISLYGAAKLASEQLMGGYSASFGMEVTCLRYFNVYGPRQDPKSPYSGVISIFSDRFHQGAPVTVFGDGSQTRDFVSVYDVAKANVAAATGTGVGRASLNVCTGQRRSLVELLAIFQDLYPQAPSPVFSPARAGEILHSGGNPRRTREVLGFKPSLRLEDGIRDLVGYRTASGTLVAS